MAEKLYFSEGKELDVLETDIGRIGLLVCYDVLFPETVRLLAIRGADMVAVGWNAAQPVNPAGDGSGDYLVQPGYPPTDLASVVRVRAFENTITLVSASRVGDDINAGIRFHGFSEIVSPLGLSLASCISQGEEVVCAEVLTDLQTVRAHRPLLRDRRPCSYGGLET